MTHALVLIAKKRDFDASVLNELRRSLENAQEPFVLSEKEAWEIRFSPPRLLEREQRRKLTEKLRGKLENAPADLGIVPLADRRKKLLVTDMDSTVIAQECLDELAAEIGLRDQVAAITGRAMRGEIAFASALRERVALLKDLPLAHIERVLRERIQLTAGAKTLVATMKANGAAAVLVSGGFTAFTQDIASRLSCEHHFANRLEVRDGHLTGKVIEPVLGEAAKRESLLIMCRKLGLRPENALALGDGANDAPMLQAAGLGIAFRGKPVLNEIADIQLNHADLTAALYIQGYSSKEFVTS